jgi:hypothetical protein
MKSEMIAGHKIGGRTWISDAWSAGTLRREDVKKEIADWTSDIGKTDEEIIAELRESEAWVAREAFENRADDDPRSYDEFLDKCVEREVEYVRNELDAKEEVADALQKLHDNWDDESRFELVCQAHTALDAYCGSMKHGEFYWD